MIKLNKNGTVKGLKKGKAYSRYDITNVLQKYGKVTSYMVGSYGRIFEVNGLPAISVNDTSRVIYEKYSIKQR